MVYRGCGAGGSDLPIAGQKEENQDREYVKWDHSHVRGIVFQVMIFIESNWFEYIRAIHGDHRNGRFR